MSPGRRHLRLRTRLAASYVLLAAAIMTLFTAATGAAIFFEMRAQLGHFAVQDIETVEGLLTPAADGKVIVREDYHNHPESRRMIEHYIEVLDTRGGILYRNEQLRAGTLGPAPLPQEGVGGYSQRWARLSDGTRVVLVSRRHLFQGTPVLIRLALSEEPVWRTLDIFLIAAALTFALVIVAAILVAFRMSAVVLEPIESIAARAGQITFQQLHERLPSRGTGDEADQLAQSFNTTLARLDDSFRQLRQFTSDASHELRTPLAALRAVGEVGLERSQTVQDYRDLVGSMLEEVSRLTHLVDDLLLVSRGDSGAVPVSLSELRVLDLIRDTAALLEPLAEEKHQTLAIEGDANAGVYGDPALLRQALINIVHNSIKYSPHSALTLISVRHGSPGATVVEIRDQGPGIASEHIPRIFDRFYRVDAGRSRDAGGFGLGLAISQWAVQAQGGTIDVTSSPGEGSTFRITLPSAALSAQ